LAHRRIFSKVTKGARNIKVIPYSRQTVSLLDSLKVGWHVWRHSLTQGPMIGEFEKSVAAAVDAKYAVAVSSATAGLHIALAALEKPKGGEVLTSPISFMASSNAAFYADLVPRFIDIDPNTLNMDIAKVSDELESNNQIVALIPVHFGGLPCDLQTISQRAKSRGIPIVEDAAHALGSTYPCGSKVGSCKYSDMTVFSFHPVKSVTTGEGGVITTNDPGLYNKLLQLRSHGIDQLGENFATPLLASTNGVKNPWYHEMQRLGYHYRLTEIQAVLGISQMKKLDKFIRKRQSKSKFYDASLKESILVRPAQLGDLSRSARHLYVIRIDYSKINLSRAEIMHRLRRSGIGTQVHYRPIPQQPYYVGLGYDFAKYPEALHYYTEALSIPLFPTLSNRQQKYILKTLLQLLEENQVSD
jgi:UDP-4-amino-4,6-dideoxy-N-acetyl-beta-L-altrosamine transaminase